MQRYRVSKIKENYPPYHRANSEIADDNVGRWLAISDSILIPTTLDCYSIIADTYVAILNQHIVARICKGQDFQIFKQAIKGTTNNKKKQLENHRVSIRRKTKSKTLSHY